MTIIPLPLLGLTHNPIVTSPKFKHSDFLERLVAGVEVWPQLKTLRVTIGLDSVMFHLKELIGRMPRLERLDFEPLEYDRAYLNAQEPWPVLPNLAYLNFDHREEAYAPLFLVILNAAPNLHTVLVEGNWSPYKSSPAVQALRKHVGLKRVIWVCDDMKLGHLVDGAMSGVEEIVLQTYWLDETEEMIPDVSQASLAQAD